MADPYVYPGTQVLRNLLDIRDAAGLQTAERLLSAQRLERSLPDVPITYDGYKALHRHLFERLYEWAGEPRSVNIAKGETIFAPPGRIDPLMERQFMLLGHERFLENLTPERFASRAAVYVSEINAVHPFREGNGRAQRAFLQVLARQAGHQVDLQRIEPTAWLNASISGFAADYGPMTAVIGAALVPSEEGREVGRLNAPQVSDAFRERLRRAAREQNPVDLAPKKPGPDYDID